MRPSHSLSESILFSENSFQPVLPSRVLLLCLLAASSFLAWPSVGAAFGPCSDAWPAGIAYVPSARACGKGNKAAAIIWGPLARAYSIVVRDCQNGDRDPCYNNNPNSCATNQSSPFKVQKEVKARIRQGGQLKGARILCFKESGNSLIYQYVRRMTIKKTNPIVNPADLLKLCLRNRKVSKNAPQIVSTGQVTMASNFGYTRVCATQRYLGCNYVAVSKQRCDQLVGR